MSAPSAQSATPLSLVLAGFMLVCLVVALVVGGDQMCEPAGRSEATRAAWQAALVKEQVTAAQKQLSRAESALSSTNYGAARQAVSAAAKELDLLVRQLRQASEDQKNANQSE